MQHAFGNFRFLLGHLKEGVYEADTYIVNRKHGSSYDIWMQMGAPERFSNHLRDYLESVAVPKYQYEKYLVDSRGEIQFSVLLEPLEVRLICFRKK